jgi:membrane-associated PAP2 superfamily phosphatase
MTSVLPLAARFPKAMMSERPSRGLFPMNRIEHLHGAVGPHLDVRRLEIAVDDPLLVRRLERRRDGGRCGDRLVDRQDLEGDVTAETRVAGAVDLAHAAGAERPGDFVWPETGAGLQAHGRKRYQKAARGRRALIPGGAHVMLRPPSWGQPAGLLIAAAATTALFWTTDLDLRVSALFHRPGGPGGPWPAAGWPICVALHRLTPWLAAALAAAGVAMMAAGRRRAGGRALTAHGLLVVLGLALGPGLVVNVLCKEQVRRPRPHRTATLGGDHRYVPPLAPGPHGRSFPCGDASVGFAFGAFGYVLRQRRPAAARIAVGTAVLLGFAIGAARVAAGAHFLSDVLWSGFLVWGTLLALDRILLRIVAGGAVRESERVAAAGRVAIVRPGRRRAALVAAGGLALAVVLLLALPFEQVVDRSWVPAPGAGGGVRAGDDAPWRVDVRIDAGSARVLLEPGGRLADGDRAPDRGAALALHGRLSGFGSPRARVQTTVEAQEDRRLVRVRVRRRGWFTDLEGTMEVRIAAATAAEIEIEVTDGVLTLVAAPGAGPLPVVITRTRPDALRLRGVRPDQVRIAGPRTESGPP